MAQHDLNEREHRRHRGSFASFTLASILIWAGVVLLLDKLNLIRGLRWEIWAIIMAGAGGIILIQALIRLLTPSHDRRALGSLILGLILLAVGVSNATSWGIILPVALIVAGLAVAFGGLFRR